MSAYQSDMRLFENCTDQDILKGHRIIYSVEFKSLALRYCTQHQISAHCLPQNSTQVLHFLHAVGWNVQDYELGGKLAQKLLDMVKANFTTSVLGPGLIEAADQPGTRCTSWTSTWAQYTLSWTTPGFFLWKSTSPNLPTGMSEDLRLPRAGVPRPYVSPIKLVKETCKALQLLNNLPPQVNCATTPDATHDCVGIIDPAPCHRQTPSPAAPMLGGQPPIVDSPAPYQDPIPLVAQHAPAPFVPARVCFSERIASESVQDGEVPPRAHEQDQSPTAVLQQAAGAPRARRHSERHAGVEEFLQARAAEEDAALPARQQTIARKVAQKAAAIRVDQEVENGAACREQAAATGLNQEGAILLARQRDQAARLASEALRAEVARVQHMRDMLAQQQAPGSYRKQRSGARWEIEQATPRGFDANKTTPKVKRAITPKLPSHTVDLEQLTQRYNFGNGASTSPPTPAKQKYALPRSSVVRESHIDQILAKYASGSW